MLHTAAEGGTANSDRWTTHLCGCTSPFIHTSHNLQLGSLILEAGGGIASFSKWSAVAEPAWPTEISPAAARAPSLSTMSCTSGMPASRSSTSTEACSHT